MADNIPITAGSGTVIAADDITSVYYQRVKIAHGADGSATDTSATAPFPITEVGQGTVFYGTKAVTGTEAALDSNACRQVTIKALGGNVIPVYLGVTGVATSTGYELQPNDAVTLHITNTNLVYVIASTTGASVCYIGTT